MAVTPDPRAAAPQSILPRMAADRPAFHSLAGEDRIWHATGGTLALLERLVVPGHRTLETGSGASTVVFAARGARHTAISPAPDEHRRIRSYCDSIGVSTKALEFIAEPSDVALPGFDPGEPLDVAFIDGAHRFPYPLLDWHYVSRLLRVGGVLVLDDVPVPAVAVAYRFMNDDPAWELLEVADSRAAAFRKLAEAPTSDRWRDQPFNRDWPDYSFEPVVKRTALRARHVARSLRRTAATRYPGLRRAYRRIRPHA